MLDFLKKVKRTWFCRHVWQSRKLVVVQDGTITAAEKWPTTVGHVGCFVLVQCRKCECHDLVDAEDLLTVDCVTGSDDDE